MGAEERVQSLRVLATFPEDSGLVPNSHIRWPTTFYNSSSRGPDASGLLGHLHSCAHAHMQTHTLTHNVIA